MWRRRTRLRRSPSRCATQTKSRSLTEAARVLVRRANCGVNARPMATTTLVSLGRKIAVTASATMIGG